MQTFLPYRSFVESAACLDRQRLGKQRVEAWQILNALRGLSKGWTQHPATRMWTGYENALAEYGLIICDEWIARGYRDTLRERFFDVIRTTPGFGTVPAWLGDPAVHASHRSNLLRKDPVWYGQYGWTEDPADPYVWPTPAQAAASFIK